MNKGLAGVGRNLPRVNSSVATAHGVRGDLIAGRAIHRRARIDRCIAYPRIRRDIHPPCDGQVGSGVGWIRTVCVNGRRPVVIEAV